MREPQKKDVAVRLLKTILYGISGFLCLGFALGLMRGAPRPAPT